MSAVKFKLDLSVKPTSNSIQYQHKTFLIGSCFTENMGIKLQHHLFDTLENPHGILFNPVSVQNALTDYVNNKDYTASDLFLLNEVWNSWHHHSRFSGVTQQAALEKINTSIQKAHTYLKSANHLVITLGSAWIYELTDQALGKAGLIVANNHKAPSNWFTKRLLKPEELLNKLQELTSILFAFNPNLQIIFTISPVRHLREGLVENNRSKAVLIQAVHDLVESTKQVTYFPAYELVIDDLRDYRFYAEDLVHPNYAATTYVWEKFVGSYMKPETQVIMKQVAELQLAANHKPFFEGSLEHQKFLQSCLAKSEQLQQKYPQLPLQNHLQFFKSQIGK